jgi:YGGT family
MNPSSPVNWYVQAPSLVLALLSYLLLARFALDLAFGARGDNIALRALRGVTSPVVRPVGAITPRVVPLRLLSGCALLWIFAARIALVQVAAAMAMRRMMG